MPYLQTLLGELNVAFSRDRVHELAERKEIFAPGRHLGSAVPPVGSSSLHDAIKSYVSRIPGGLTEALRATLYHALSTEPPTLVTFAWVPSYDYELNIWQAPDTKATRGGITVVIKSRYPDDRHPLDTSTG